MYYIPAHLSIKTHVILPLRRPYLFSQGKLLSPKKVFCYMAYLAQGRQCLPKQYNLMIKWFGGAQKLVTVVFSLAYKLQPTILFIDDIFLGQHKTTYHEALNNMKTEFMASWDGFTTNQLGEAILRRLPHAFEIGLPNRKERAAILRVILKDEKVEDDIDYDHLTSLCDIYTGSDLPELCKKAAYFPIRDWNEVLDDVDRLHMLKSLAVSFNSIAEIHEEIELATSLVKYVIFLLYLLLLVKALFVIMFKNFGSLLESFHGCKIRPKGLDESP
ncbi:hypothetical protein ACS0TY_023462 [Phlomoides rotata]